jgi:predicted XRE-type DNA-binding protein
MDMIKGSENVFSDLGFDSDEAENLKHRANLMLTLNQYLKGRNLTQVRASELLEVSQPRISDLKTGKIDNFTIDSLINMLSKIGVRVSIGIDGRAA